MNQETEKQSTIRLVDVVKARCPRCHTGKITRGWFKINKRCPVCDLDFYPESGYYLGAMMVAYLVTAVLTIPTIIALKLANVDMTLLFSLPLVQYCFLGPWVIHYSKVLWFHLEYSMSERFDGKK